MKGSIVPFNRPSSTHKLRLQIPGYVPDDGIMITSVSDTRHPIAYSSTQTNEPRTQITPKCHTFCSKDTTTHTSLAINT